MAMISYPMKAAERDDCIFALFPFNGGSFLNRLRSDSTLFPVPGSSETGNWAERNGLFKKVVGCKVYPRGFSNIRDVSQSDEGLLDENRDTYIRLVSSLRLCRNKTSKTFIAKAWFRRSDTTTRQQRGILIRHELMSQGMTFNLYEDSAVFNWSIRETWDEEKNNINNRDFKLFTGFILEDIDAVDSSTRERVQILTPIDPDLCIDKFAVYAMVVDYDQTPGSMIIRSYINGELISTYTHAAKAWNYVDPSIKWHGSDLTPLLGVSLHSEETCVWSSYDWVSWGLVFDSVLSEEEIRKFK